MTTQAKKVVKIKPLEGYTAMSDADIVQRGTAAQTGLTGNSNFQNLPVDLAVLKTDIESLSALIAESLDGSKKVIAQKNKQREAVIKMLLLLGRFVEVHCNGDMAIFTSSGFVPASTAKVPPAPLPLPVIRSVDHGVISGEIVVQVEAIPKAVHYEIRYGAQVNGAAPGSWTSKVVTKVKPPVGFQGLTPGTVYAFQVRALGKVGYTDWTDSATCMCTWFESFDHRGLRPPVFLHRLRLRRNGLPLQNDRVRFGSTKFDHGTPDPLRTSLTLHDVSTAYEKGWSKLRNGDLLNVAEREGYDVWSVPTTSPCRRYWQISCAVMGFVVVGVHTPGVS